MTKVYVVFGATGEYSDHHKWPIQAYTTEEAAQEHVLKASKRSREIIVQYPNLYDIPDGANEWDKKMDILYPGVNYSYVTVNLFNELTGRGSIEPEEEK